MTKHSHPDALLMLKDVFTTAGLLNANKLTLERFRTIIESYEAERERNAERDETLSRVCGLLREWEQRFPGEYATTHLRNAVDGPGTLAEQFEETAGRG